MVSSGLLFVAYAGCTKKEFIKEEFAPGMDLLQRVVDAAKEGIGLSTSQLVKKVKGRTCYVWAAIHFLQKQGVFVVRKVSGYNVNLLNENRWHEYLKSELYEP